MKIILDTNVLISGIFFSGPPSQILEAWRDGKFKLVLSQQILDEYMKVIDRISMKYKGIDIDRFLELITIKSEMSNTIDIDRSICKDSSDIKFIACAIAAKAKIIVSGDNHLLELNGYQDIEIISPIGFIEKYLKS